jgi:hypothetical protein
MEDAMKKLRIRLFYCLLIVLTSYATTSAQIPDKTEELTSFEIQKSKKEIYNAGLKVLSDLEYKVIKDKKYKYLEGKDTEVHIHRIRLERPGEFQGTRIDYNARIWIEQLSKKSTRIDIFVTEQKYDHEFGKDPRLIETNRLKNMEEKIKEKLEYFSKFQ